MVHAVSTLGELSRSSDRNSPDRRRPRATSTHPASRKRGNSFDAKALHPIDQPDMENFMKIATLAVLLLASASLVACGTDRRTVVVNPAPVEAAPPSTVVVIPPGPPHVCPSDAPC
jgi:hypothetical protein